MIKPLTSLRFLFALMVFCSHLQFVDGNLYPSFKDITGEGFIGVSFFFILSGFILSLNYDEKLLSRQVSFREFWVARIARIYPLHLLTLLLAVGLVIDQTPSWSEFFVDPAASIVMFLSNAALIHAFIPVIEYFFSYNGPSWSISAEMFFYFAFPFIIFLFVRNKALLRYGWLLFLAVPVVMNYSHDDGHHRFMYVNPFFRIVDFVVGITLHQFYKRGYLRGLYKAKPGATLLELLAFGVFGVAVYYRGEVVMGYRYSSYYWLPMVLIIFSFAHQGGYLSAVFSTRIWVWLGEISFSFYLIHQLVIRYLLTLNDRHALDGSNEALGIAMFGVSLGLSYVLHRFVELPSNRAIKARYKRSRFAPAVLALPVAEAVPVP
ncbi:acyltransferase [Hymenobacter terrigena]